MHFSSTRKGAPAVPTTFGPADLAAAALVLVLSSIAVARFVPPWYDRTLDGSLYLITARSLAEGGGYSYLGEPFRLRPPGLALLLAPFVGDGVPDFARITALLASLAPPSLLALFVWARGRLSTALALAVTLTVAALPGFWRLAAQVMTDVLGLGILCTVLALEHRCARRAAAWPHVLNGALVAAGAYLRNSLFLLLPAVILGRWLGRGATGARAPLRGTLIFAATTLLAIAPWSVRQRLTKPPPPADQSWQYSAWTLLWHEEATDPASPRVPLARVAARIPERLGELIDGLGRGRVVRDDETAAADESAHPAPWRRAFGALLLAVSIVAWIRRREAAEHDLALYVATLALLPIPVLERYLLPILALTLVETAAVADALARRILPARLATAAVVAALFCLCAANWPPLEGRERREREQREWNATCAALAPRLAPTDRVGAAAGWHLEVFLDRPVHSLRIAWARDPRREAVEQVIARYALDTIVLLEGDTPPRLQRMLLERYPVREQFKVDGRRIVILDVGT